MRNLIKRNLLQFSVLESEYAEIKAIIEKQQKICRSVPRQHAFTLGDTLEYIVKEWAKLNKIDITEK